MGERTKGADPAEEDRVVAWNAWLDGDSVHRIQRYDLPELSYAKVAALLQGDPPDSLRDDVRHLHQGRYFWVSASGLKNEDTGKHDAFVVVRSPRTYSAAAFGKALRAIRSEVRAMQPGADLSLDVMEGFGDQSAGPLFVDENGAKGFHFDAKGNVGRIERKPRPATSACPGDDEEGPATSPGPR